MTQPLDTSHGPHRFRNLAKVRRTSQQDFDRAYERGLMGLHGRSLARRDILVDTKRVTDFLRCGYLGLDSHPALLRGAIEAMREYGSVHWSCARTRLNSDLIRDLEARLSHLWRARTVVFSMVSLANEGMLPLLASGELTGGHKPLMVFDRRAHASLALLKPVAADETRVETIGHSDIDALEDLCKKHANVAYITDGVNSMGGAAPIADLVDLQQRYGLVLYIDDAHGVSIQGKNGCGYARSRLTMSPHTIVVVSLGKGFGTAGGAVMLGSAEQESVVRRYAAPFAFSAPPAIPVLGAALASARLHGSSELPALQRRLQRRIARFDAQVPTRQKGDGLPIRMIDVGDEGEAIELADRLLADGLYVMSAFFPTVARGQAALRIALSADHLPRQIDRLAERLHHYRRR